MEQILSQEEIDALMSGLSEGEIEPQKEVEAEIEQKIEVQTFDFVKYTKSKKENLPALQFIYDRFAKSFRSALSLFVEKDVEMEQGPMQYIEYREFIKTLPLPTNMNIVVTENLKGFFIVIFDAKLIFSVLETIFGSSNASVTRIEGREFTKIEIGVIKKMVDIVSVEMEKAWTPVYEIKCKYSRSEMNPNYITMVSPEETVSLCEISVEIGDITGWIKICMPYGILESIKSYLISTPSREDMDMREKWLKKLMERTSDVPLEIKAVLGRRKMSLEDFLKVTEDNIIMVDRCVDDPVDILINDKIKFKGKLGILKGSKAVMIEEGIN
ncbi:MAG: flagellar motor switch protein FliM [Proteobacteria bacterium]|nr:flagellar motor switch protein FliM [Pseudomonadota bacterium]